MCHRTIHDKKTNANWVKAIALCLNFSDGGPHSVKPASQSQLVDPNDAASRGRQVAVKRTYTNVIRSKSKIGAANYLRMPSFEMTVL
jgi:hypothetical protein